MYNYSWAQTICTCIFAIDCSFVMYIRFKNILLYIYLFVYVRLNVNEGCCCFCYGACIACQPPIHYIGKGVMNKVFLGSCNNHAVHSVMVDNRKLSVPKKAVLGSFGLANGLKALCFLGVLGYVCLFVPSSYSLQNDIKNREKWWAWETGILGKTILTFNLRDRQTNKCTQNIISLSTHNETSINFSIFNLRSKERSFYKTSLSSDCHWIRTNIKTSF